VKKPNNTVKVPFPAETKQLLDEIAKKKGTITATLIKRLLAQFALHRDDIKTVVLQIPLATLADKDMFVEWFGAEGPGLDATLFSRKLSFYLLGDCNRMML
jgi:hypothetical protein